MTDGSLPINLFSTAQAVQQPGSSEGFWFNMIDWSVTPLLCVQVNASNAILSAEFKLVEPLIIKLSEETEMQEMDTHDKLVCGSFTKSKLIFVLHRGTLTSVAWSLKFLTCLK